SVAVDTNGNVYVADQVNHTIRKVTSAGVVTTLAGRAGSSGSANGGAAARFNGPTGVAVDSAGNVYVADFWNSTIRKVTSAGAVTANTARFPRTTRSAADAAGNTYVAVSVYDTICNMRLVGTTWGVTTLGGGAGMSGSTEGTGIAARFNSPNGVAVDSAGNLY